MQKGYLYYEKQYLAGYQSLFRGDSFIFASDFNIDGDSHKPEAKADLIHADLWSGDMLALSASSALSLSPWRYYTTPGQVTFTGGVQEGLMRVKEGQHSSSEPVSGETDVLHEMFARNGAA